MRKTYTETATPPRPEIDSDLDNTVSYNPRTAPTTKRVFLTGVACVGKTTIGAELSRLLGYRFYDLDHEVETYYGTSIERLQNQHKSIHHFRKAAAKVLDHILSEPESCDCIIALPPRGLMGAYWKIGTARRGDDCRYSGQAGKHSESHRFFRRQFAPDRKGPFNARNEVVFERNQSRRQLLQDVL